MALLARGIEFLFSDAANMGCIARLFYRRFAGWAVVGFVQTQVRLLFPEDDTDFDDNGFESSSQDLTIMDIGSGDDDA